MRDPHFELAEEQGHFLFEHERRPRQARHRFDAGEETRETFDFRLHVRFATLDDHLVRAAARDHLLRAFFEIRRCAEHAHGVVVRQHDVFDRFVGNAADLCDEVLRHGRRGGGVDDQHAVVADDHARVRIAFSGVRVGVLGQLGPRDFLDFQVCLGCECLCHACLPQKLDVRRDGRLRVQIQMRGLAVLGVVSPRFDSVTAPVCRGECILWPGEFICQ